MLITMGTKLWDVRSPAFRRKGLAVQRIPPQGEAKRDYELTIDVIRNKVFKSLLFGVVSRLQGNEA